MDEHDYGRIFPIVGCIADHFRARSGGSLIALEIWEKVSLFNCFSHVIVSRLKRVYGSAQASQDVNKQQGTDKITI